MINHTTPSQSRHSSLFSTLQLFHSMLISLFGKFLINSILPFSSFPSFLSFVHSSEIPLQLLTFSSFPFLSLHFLFFMPTILSLSFTFILSLCPSVCKFSILFFFSPLYSSVLSSLPSFRSVFCKPSIHTIYRSRSLFFKSSISLPYFSPFLYCCKPLISLSFPQAAS